MRTIAVAPDLRAEHPAPPVGPAAVQPSTYVVSTRLGIVAAGVSAAMWFLPDLLHDHLKE